MLSSGLDASQDRLKERISGKKWKQRSHICAAAMGLGSTFSQVLSLDPIIPLKDSVPTSASLKQKWVELGCQTPHAPSVLCQKFLTFTYFLAVFCSVLLRGEHYGGETELGDPLSLLSCGREDQVCFSRIPYPSSNSLVFPFTATQRIRRAVPCSPRHWKAPSIPGRKTPIGEKLLWLRNAPRPRGWCRSPSIGSAGCQLPRTRAPPGKVGTGIPRVLAESSSKGGSWNWKIGYRVLWEVDLLLLVLEQTVYGWSKASALTQSCALTSPDGVISKSFLFVLNAVLLDVQASHWKMLREVRERQRQ